MRPSIAKMTYVAAAIVSVGGWIWLLAVMSKWLILKF